jgi:hypothetical protein
MAVQWPGLLVMHVARGKRSALGGSPQAAPQRRIMVKVSRWLAPAAGPR